MAAAITVVNLAPQVAKIFGAKDGETAVRTIGEIVLGFDFSKINVKDNTRDDYLHTGLAPSFGTLNRESLKTMDDQLKIIIAGTNRELAKIPPHDRVWDRVISTFMQNPLIEPMDTPQANVARADKLIKSGSNFFKVGREKDNGVVREVLAWFTNLISDEDVMKSTKIDINVLADIVGTTGAAIDSFETFFAKNEHHEKTVVDIGVLRYPDIDNPFFKVYRIQLTAWSDTRRILFHGEDSNGITGMYNMRLFKPRDSIISGMREETRKKAVKEAEDMFSD